MTDYTKLTTFRGVQIEMTPTFRFYAKVNGEHIHSQSIEALRKRIAEKMDFQAVDVFTRHHGKFVSVRIVGVTKDGRPNDSAGSEYRGDLYPIALRDDLEELEGKRDRMTKRHAQEAALLTEKANALYAKRIIIETP